MGSIVRHIDDMIQEFGSVEKYLESLNNEKTMKTNPNDPATEVWTPKVGDIIEWQDLEDGEWRRGRYNGKQDNGLSKIIFETCSGNIRKIPFNL